MNAVTESKAALLATATHVRDQPADVADRRDRKRSAAKIFNLDPVRAGFAAQAFDVVSDRLATESR